MDPAEAVPLYRVTLDLCFLCLGGAGGECHVPGCVLYMNRAPDLPLSADAIEFVGGQP
jgi:hypothetical protein